MRDDCFFLILAGLLFFIFEVMARGQYAHKINDRITLLEKLVVSNATYNKSLFLGFHGRENEASEFFRRFAKIPSVYRPYIEWRRLPSMHSPLINLNSLSYRGKDFAVKKSQGVYHILIYGGSFVWGTGALRDNETIAGHLEGMLNQSSNQRRYEVINCGETGFNTTQEVIYLMIEGLFLQPDLVIFLDGVNDTYAGYKGYPAGYPEHYERYNNLLTGNLKEREKESFTVDTELEYLKNQRKVIWDSKESEILNRINDTLKGKQEPGVEKIKDYTTPEEFALRHFYNVRAARALGEDFGFSVLAAIQPVPVFFKPLHPQEKLALETVRKASPDYHMELTYWENYYNQYADQVISLSKGAGVPVCDLRKVFENDTRPLYIDDCHVTSDGYNTVAERLYSAIKPIINNAQ